MKYVLQNLNYAAPYPGTLMASLFALEEGLKKENIGMIYLFPERAKNIEWIQNMQKDGKKVYFKYENPYDVLKEIAFRHELSIIHTHFWCLPDAEAIHELKMDYTRIRTVLHHHNHFMACGSSKYGFLYDAIRKIYMIPRREQIRKKIDANMYIACSDDVAKDLEKKHFKNVVAAQNAIDFSRLDSFEEYPKADGKALLIFGFDFFRKGVDLVVEAIKDIAKEKKLTLYIVFAAYQEEGTKELLKILGEIPDWIKILPAREDIATYYKMADVFLSPSREEGFCYSAIEAVYCGTNIVFSQISGQAHLKKIPGAIATKTEDVNMLKEKILNAIDTPFNDDAKKYVVDTYSLDVWVDKIISAYEMLL